ncbi:hypothetical protein CDL12_20111 [Handroanthus impetiginosus]|uniref:DUF4228 domain-containing protein n=1 Tax=Handroanthus impetiginosus TaxID=429701 RepID=A0A2G9GPU1_9LAMI|nr:hypothetical protein CDL12_20111 [Handroanthus impetiginosus]
MGNVALCAPSITSGGVVKVLSSDGRLLIYTREPMKAAEIMLANPGQFLCESSNLKVGQRIPGITAEEELERGQVYFLLPMDMLYSVLTSEELKGLNQKASKGIKQVNFPKIFPEFCLFPSGSEAKAVVDCAAIGNSNLQKLERFSRQRSWQPALETIVETPSHT